MLSQEKLLGLISRIYDAAANVDKWPLFLEDFADAVNGSVTGILYHDFQAPGVVIGSFVRFDPEFRARYSEYYGTFDPWKSAWRARFSREGPEAIVTSEELVDPHQLNRSEFYNDYLLPQDTVHQFGGPITIREGWCSIITCLRSDEKGPFDSEELELLRLLFPHLQRAMEFHRKMAGLEGRQRTSLDALNLLPTGVILLDDRGRILEVNRAARQMLNQNDGLMAKKEELAAAIPEQTKKLRSSIAAAVLRSKQGFAAGKNLTIDRPSGKRSFALMIMAASVHAFAPDARSPAVIVFVSDPELRPQMAPENLALLYELTGAESRVAQKMMQGETLVGTAEQLDIGHNTARTHLHRIYQKTGTHHQGELVRLLLAGSMHPVGDPAQN